MSSVLKKANKKDNKFHPWTPWIAGGTILFLFFIAIFHLFYQSKVQVDHLIVAHLKQLEDVFQKIDKKCKILGFSENRSYIDFVTVKEFSGSQIGPMMLMYPENWQGPYVKDNPAVQQKFYEIIKTDRGHYIVPGVGVKLSNDKVIGKDIIIDQSTDIESLLSKDAPLNFEGNPLAIKINISEGTLTEYIELIASVLAQINKHCVISRFEHPNNPINFLNVKKFVGSEIGAMNLKYPDRWKGPYAKYNPTYQGKMYQVVKAQDGYYVMPGNEVVLPDGRIIGKDIIIDENSNVSRMIAEGLLLIDNKPIAAKLEMGSMESEKNVSSRLSGLLFGEDKIEE